MWDVLAVPDPLFLLYYFSLTNIMVCLEIYLVRACVIEKPVNWFALAGVRMIGSSLKHITEQTSFKILNNL